MKKLLLTIGVIASLVALGTTLVAQAAVDNRRNCSSTAVVKCGTFSQSELNKRIKGDAKALFKKLGVSTNLKAAKDGIMKPNGDIYVGSKKVATGGYTFGREHRSGSTKVNAGGTTFYKHKASTAFPKDTPVFVFFNSDGTFRSAIAKVCGNPIVAKPTPKPYYNCEDINATKISRTSFKFKTAYTVKNGAKHKSTKYIVRDSKGKVVQNSTSTSFKTTKPGTYTVEAHVTFTANGKTVTDTSKRCKISFTVAPEPISYIKVCDLDTYKAITIDRKKFNSKEHSKNFDDCKKIKVCELKTMRIKTIRKTDFDSKKHSTNLKDCVFVIEKNIVVCDLDSYKLVTIDERDFNSKQHSTNFNDCKKIEVCDLDSYKMIDIRKTDFDGKQHSTNPDDCKKIQVCELDSYKMITIRKTDFDSKKHSTNPDDCQKIQVCELETNKLVTIRKTDFNSTKHSTNFDDCKEIVVCELDTYKMVTIRKSDFDSKKHSTNTDDCKKIQVCELATDKVITIRKTDFDSKKHSTSLDDCQRIEVCKLDTKQMITIRKTEFDETKHSYNADDCEDITVCDLDTKDVITIRKSEYDTDKHSTNMEDCKVTVCEIETKEIVKVNKDFDETKYTTDLTQCEETPVVPEELPTTGPAETIASGLGFGALIAAASYYVASRRSLFAALLGK